MTKGVYRLSRNVVSRKMPYFKKVYFIYCSVFLQRISKVCFIQKTIFSVSLERVQLSTFTITCSYDQDLLIKVLTYSRKFAQFPVPYFDVVFVHLTAPTCSVDELRCTNGRCIAKVLQCNGFDNCGDTSDECRVSIHQARHCL